MDALLGLFSLIGLFLSVFLLIYSSIKNKKNVLISIWMILLFLGMLLLALEVFIPAILLLSFSIFKILNDPEIKKKLYEHKKKELEKKVTGKKKADTPKTLQPNLIQENTYTKIQNKKMRWTVGIIIFFAIFLSLPYLGSDKKKSKNNSIPTKQTSSSSSENFQSISPKSYQTEKIETKETSISSSENLQTENGTDENLELLNSFDELVNNNIDTIREIKKFDDSWNHTQVYVTDQIKNFSKQQKQELVNQISSDIRGRIMGYGNGDASDVFFTFSYLDNTTMAESTIFDLYEIRVK